MNLVDWQASLHDRQPPESWPTLVQALWWDARGDWHRAHHLASKMETREGSWVHAFLHRREGDQANAAYWYRRAGQTICSESFDAERLTIVSALLASQAATDPRPK